MKNHGGEPKTAIMAPAASATYVVTQVWPNKYPSKTARQALVKHRYLTLDMSFSPTRLACWAALIGLCVLPRAGAQVVTETFTNSTAPNWTFTGSGYTPTLTSGVSDPSGAGWLQLTSNGNNQATSAVYNGSFSSSGATVYANFSYQEYGGTNGTTIGGDGLTFFLYDASKAFSVGAYGGSMGYAQKTAAGGGGADIAGMNGGYLAVGLDAYGNFSAGSEGRVGGY